MAANGDGSRRNIIVCGGSAGALPAFRAILSALPRDIPASVFVVQHVSPDHPTMLDQLLGRSALPVRPAEHDAEIRPGEVRTAGRDRHLVLGKDRMRLTRGPRENHARPAIDPLFRTAAVHHPGRVIAVLGSGYLSDGVAGLNAVRRCGGLTIVQDPTDAQVPELPQNALAHLEPDYVESADRIGALLGELAAQPAPEAVEIPPEIALEAAMAAGERLGIGSEDDLGRPSQCACPDCGGNLWEIDDTMLRFRCHVGHGFTFDALQEAQAAKLDEALWSTLRSLRERAELLRRIAREGRDAGRGLSSRRFELSAAEIEEQANTLQTFILKWAERHG